ncbi:MAG TPA: exosortase H-associated membrane protein [Usitatibacter sp.]|nr:exosortase H-associated membrane protein [Usitatibacter sp.]
MAEDASPGPRNGAGLSGAAPRSILGFAARAIAWGIVFFAAWYAAAQPLSLATAWCSAQFLKVLAPVDRAHPEWKAPRTALLVEFDTSTAYQHRLPRGIEYEVPADALKYTYGIPFFVALLAASRARRLAMKALAGTAVLVVLAAAGLACETALTLGTLTDATGSALWKAGGATATLFALGYQLGTLIFPTVVPAAMWVGMDGASRGKVIFSA